MAAERGVTLTAVIGDIDRVRGDHPLASACRVAALIWALEDKHSD